MLLAQGHALPTCTNPKDGADTTCPASSQCWDKDKTATLVTWSLHNQCAICTFAQQKPVVVQDTEQVTFETDGTFQRDDNLEVYKVNSLDEMKACDISSATLLGRIAPLPVIGIGDPPAGHEFSLDVTHSIEYGSNYFISLHAGDSDANSVPSNCEQGARLTVYKGRFDCKDVNNPCDDVGPCVFNHALSDFKCQCPNGFNEPFCDSINECFGVTACGDPAFEGTCVDGDCDFSCDCKGGRSSSGEAGKACDVLPTTCDDNPCLNGGSCTAFSGDIICECLQDFELPFCTEIDECASNPCQNGGICLDGPTEYTCSCANGFMGTDCSMNIDDCLQNPCLNGGNCMDGVADVSCDCMSSVDYVGKFCQINVNDCLTSKCSDDSTCVDGEFTHSCDCNPGFIGDFCETDIDECASNPCQNGGMCEDLKNGYKCECPEKFAGTNCETEIKVCESSPCQNGGSCQEVGLGNSFLCECLLGFTGDNCETDIPECESNPCQNDGTCNEEEVNSFTCNCQPGFVGDFCEIDTLECRSLPCQNGAECIELVNAYRCECVAGFDGVNCEIDIDYCQSNPCQNDGTCDEVQASFVCECLTGFSGTTCEIDIDDCISNPCQNEGTCDQLIGDGYVCECLTAFSGDQCEIFIDPCLSSPCQNDGSCSSTVDSGVASYTCECVPGYAGDNCETDIDECKSFPCANGGSCFNEINMYTCDCVKGFTGLECMTNIDECESNPCQNKGTCIDMINGYTCKCINGFIGDHCETDFDECVSNPCMNGGSCNNLIDMFTCECLSGFTDEMCQTNIDDCASNPCENGAVCLDGDRRYDCRCVPGYTGTHCERNVQECASNPCLNGGTCEEHQINDHRCICPPGFTGKLCETDINECASNPCLNGGTCVDGVDQYICECVAEFSGVNCEIVVDACTIFTPCKNQGTCTNIPTVIGDIEAVDFNLPPTDEVDIHDAYNCSCLKLYTGRICDEFIPMPPPPPLSPPPPVSVLPPPPTLMPPPPAAIIGPPPPLMPPPPTEGFDCTRDSQQCLNGGSCVEDNSYCSCPFPFIGQQCEIDGPIGVPGFGNIVDSFLRVSTDLTSSITQTIGISIEPLSPDGLVFLAAQNPNGLTDFIALFLVDWFPVWKFDLGSGTATVTSSVPVPQGLVSVIELRRDGMVGELVLNGVVVGTGISPGLNDIADLEPHIYLGGVANVGAIQNPEISPLTGFKGCIRSLSLDSTEVDILVSATAGMNVDVCPVNTCLGDPCQNDGICVRTGFGLLDFECLCPDGYGGPTCEILTNNCTLHMPCLHGGMCHDDSNVPEGYRCICSATHIGPRCEIPVGNTTVDYSYAGDSFVSWYVNRSTVEIITDISLRVYPDLNSCDGLLAIFIRPSLDFLAIVLEDCFVKVVVDLGQGPLTVTSNSQLPGNQYSTITVNRNGQDVDLTVSGDSTVAGTTPGVFSQLNVDDRLYIGGVPPKFAVTLPPALVRVFGFVGCIEEVTVNGQFLYSTELLTGYNVVHCGVDLCDPNPCQNGGTCSSVGNSVSCTCPAPFSEPYCKENPCQDTTCAAGSTCVAVGEISICACPHGKGGEQCDQDVVLDVLSFSGVLTSYMMFPPLGQSSLAKTDIYISIKPLLSYGLIFYAPRLPSPSVSDFISVGLYDGFVEFRYNLGSGTVVIKSAERIDLYEWHIIHAGRDMKEGFLIVDGGAEVQGTSPGESSILDAELAIYLGGHEDFSKVSEDLGLTDGFTGCIDTGKANDQLLNYPSATSSRGVSECDDHPCDRIDCYNGGTCTIVDGQGTYGCMCAHGFKGVDCKTMIENHCSIGTDTCHESSYCVFNYKTETYECFCPLTPIPRDGDLCENSEIQPLSQFYKYPQQFIIPVLSSYNIQCGQVLW
jgi:hypothetical protein